MIFLQFALGWLGVGIFVSSVALAVQARVEVRSWNDFDDFMNFVLAGDHDWLVITMFPAVLVVLLGMLFVAAPAYVAWLTIKRVSILRGITAKLEGQ